MRRGTVTELRIATASGPGSGSFLARALLDVLEAGATLGGVHVRPANRAGGAWSLDFVFVHARSDRGEIVRAGLDSAGNVVTAELLRTARPHGRKYRWADSLADAIRGAAGISGVRLEPGAAGEPRTVRVGLAGGGSYVLDLADFEPDVIAH